MSPGGEHHHPDEGHDEAEDGDEHDPALRVRRHHQRARHQDPDQTTEHLQHTGEGSARMRDDGKVCDRVDRGSEK